MTISPSFFLPLVYFVPKLYTDPQLRFPHLPPGPNHGIGGGFPEETPLCTHPPKNLDFDVSPLLLASFSMTP